jgi:very-short-patch-repair endonuclease
MPSAWSKSTAPGTAAPRSSPPIARTQVREACGFHVLRVTNADVYENLEGVLETILAELERRSALNR